jgi:hypothetical protein
MHGRDPALFEKLTLPSPFDHDAIEDVPHTNMNNITNRLKASFLLVAVHQERIALKNRKARETNNKIVEYEVNDHVMYWEPSQPNHLAFTANAAHMDDDSDVARCEAHRSWKCRWTGPHRITEHSAGKYNRRYTISHISRGDIANIKSDRLHPYTPWSDAHPSTSPDLDAARVRTHTLAQKNWHLVPP